MTALERPTEPTTALRAAIADILAYQIPELLLNIERAYLRGQTLPMDWFVRQIAEFEAELAAVL